MITTESSRVPQEEEALPPPFSRRMRLAALFIAVVMLAFVVLTAGASLLGRPPTPDHTRPLPYLPPTQGAIR